MKKNIIFVIFAAAAVLAACNKEAAQTPVQGGVTGPQTVVASINESKAVNGQGIATFKAGEIIDIFYSDKSKESVTLTDAMISADGKTATFEILGTTTENLAVYPGVANTKWTTGEGPKYALGSRSDGLASGKISNGTLVLSHVASVVSFSANEIPAGSTFAYLVAKSHEAVIPQQAQFNFETGAATGDNFGKYVFTNKLSDKNDIRVTTLPGDYFEDGFVLAFAKAYGAATEVVGKRLFVNKSLSVGQGQFIRLGNIDNNTVVLGTEAYRTVTLDDGNTWMAENLRYVPAGKTVAELKNDYTGVDCDGIYYPATFAVVEGNAVVTPSSDIPVVLEQGLLYTAAAAMNGETIPTTDFADCDNKQGICPEGWHIPTAQEWVNLVGACAATAHNNVNAPYYVQSLAGADLSALNTDRFNFLPFPFVNQGKKYLGSYLNKRADSEYNIYASMCYFQSSTGRSATQNYAAMITNNNTKTSVNCAYNNLTNATPVRCVKNK